jgi:hypothetical protein
MHDIALLADDPDGLELATLIGRHFVSMVVAGKFPGGQVKHTAYSAFLFSIDDQWCLVTAGHNIANIKAAIAQGFDVIAWDLSDAFGGGRFMQTVPSGVSLEDWWTLFSDQDPSGLDIALAPIPSFITLALQKNGAVPLQMGADYLRLSPIPADRMVLAGTAAETTTVVNARLHQSMHVIPVSGIALDDVVPALREGPVRRIYGAIQGDGWASAGLTHIGGMSGGPVFGIWIFPESNAFDYAAIGIQSGWDKASKQIAAWPLDVLSHAIAERMPQLS